MKLDQCRVLLSDRSLEFLAEPRDRASEIVSTGAGSAVPELDAEPSDVVAFATPMIEARQVDVLASDAVIIQGLAAVQVWYQRLGRRSNLFAEVLADYA